jgi:hypothetical protein
MTVLRKVTDKGGVDFVGGDAGHAAEVDRAGAFVAGGALDVLVDDLTAAVGASGDFVGRAKEGYEGCFEGGSDVHRAAVVSEEDGALFDEGDELAQRRGCGEIDHVGGHSFADFVDKLGSCRIGKTENICVGALC